VTPPPLQVIRGDATPEEVAAITAAMAALWEHHRAAVAEAAQTAAALADGPASHWVQASRLSARRCGLMRGPWRLSGRIGRRSRA